jgi:hypothetical protein
MKGLTIIGRAEVVTFPSAGGLSLHARIDTGARTSSIWASKIEERQDGLHVWLADEEHDINKHELVFTDYSQVVVASSTGHEQLRFKVKMPIIIKHRRILASFTLADRSNQVYPVLIGRLTLNNKFLVDVSHGDALREKEKVRSKQLQKKLIVKGGLK